MPEGGSIIRQSSPNTLTTNLSSNEKNNNNNNNNMGPREAPEIMNSTDTNSSTNSKINNNKNNGLALDVPIGGDGNSASKPGYFLRWSRIEKTVETGKNMDANGLMGGSSLSSSFRKLDVPTKKSILKSVSGYAKPGEILACMGPSGSGKTSLMNVLSGRSSYQNGAISINGKIVNASDMKRLMADVAYVKQADIFFDHLSVRDQLTYTALLRMGGDSKECKNAEVDKVLDMLRLRKVADSPIKMVSGGERKRVNIATELLTDPSVLLLDEPTSGLDSTSAVALLKLLHTMAIEHEKTIITSIHQPSSSMFHSFDRLILLSEGTVVYFGTPTNSLNYLNSQNLQCPPGFNAADHWMDLLVQDSAVDDDIHKGGTPARLILESAWDHEAVAEEVDNDTTMSNDASSSISWKKIEKYNTSWVTQYYILTHRALKNSRSAIFTPLNLCKSLAIGLVAGMLWFQTEYAERNVNDIRSYYFFTMTFWVFDAMFTALTAFPSEREVILKERASGSYHLSAYFMAKTTADAPVRLILPLIYMIVSFWMAGISTDFGIFCGTIGCTLLSVVAGETIGLLVGAAVYDLQKGLTIMTVFTLFLMLLGGFFVENVPTFIAWGKFLSPFKYAFDSSLQLVFNRDIPCDGSGALEELCNAGSDTGYAPIEDVRDFVGIQGSIGFNVGMLLVICFLPRYFAYLFLRMKKSGDRS